VGGFITIAVGWPKYSSANIVAPDDVAVDEQIDDQNNVESDGENV
jgi:hypothetical protein